MRSGVRRCAYATVRYFRFYPYARTNATSGVTPWYHCFHEVGGLHGPSGPPLLSPSTASAPSKRRPCPTHAPLPQLWGESSVALEMDGQQHYVRGGKPGYFPTIKDKMPHPVPLNFWDPLGTMKKMTPERKAQGLRAEINNGRLAMVGIIGMCSASKGLIVPGLDAIPNFPRYAGEYMAPLSAANADMPFVSDMLGATFPWTA